MYDDEPSTEKEYLEGIYKILNAGSILGDHQRLVRQDMFIEELRSYLSQIIQLLNLIRLEISKHPQTNKNKE